MEKWKTEYLEDIKLMPNDEVLGEYVGLSQGDGWDGYLSKRGEWKYKKIWIELETRLNNVGFFQTNKK